MAKPFQIPDWRKRQIRDKFRRKDAVISQTVRNMEGVMSEAVTEIMHHFEVTGQYAPPTLNRMFNVSESFYRSVIVEALHTAKREKLSQDGKKRLAAPGPLGLPKTLKDLEKVFRDHRYWPKILKRSRILTERLRRQYLEKLAKKFKSVIPRLHSGELTPLDVKKQMMETWGASKSRVETLFRTETTTYFGKTQTAFFEGDPEIIGFLFDSVRDTSRTSWCSSRHGLVYRPGSKLLRENTPSLHPNCRSHLIALANTPYNRKLLEDPKRNPETNRVVPLLPGWKK